MDSLKFTVRVDLRYVRPMLPQQRSLLHQGYVMNAESFSQALAVLLGFDS